MTSHIVNLKVRIISKISRARESYDACSFFERKRVVLIGPSIVSSQKLSAQVDSADVLVVVNKGHRSDIFRSLSKLAKSVALFHCLDFDEKTGGGEFDSFELRRMGFTSVFYPLSEARFDHNVANFHARNTALLRLRRIPHDCYRALQKSIDGFTPNSGFAAIWSIVCGGCSNLYVTGLNFFRLPYSEGYHHHLASLQQAISLIERFGNHNPDLDLESFRVLFSEGRIQVDDQLKEILARPPERMFYLNGPPQRPDR